MRPTPLLAAAVVAAFAGCSDPGSPSTPTDPGTVPGTPQVVDPTDPTTPGTANPVDPGNGLPSWHSTTPLANPTLHAGIGRAPHRITVSQLRASLTAAIGVTWREPRRILTAESTTGYVDDPDADMLTILAPTLGEPNYDQATQESLDPNATFAKLLGDAARKACRDGVVEDVARSASSRVLLRYANPQDTAAGNETAVRRNLQYLVLRFWSRSVEPSSTTVSDLLRLFTVASTAPAEGTVGMGGFAAGTTADGWRAVCIALTTDNQFLTY